MFTYDAIIRTCNSAAALADTIAGLRSQVPPHADQRHRSRWLQGVCAWPALGILIQSV